MEAMSFSSASAPIEAPMESTVIALIWLVGLFGLFGLFGLVGLFGLFDFLTRDFD